LPPLLLLLPLLQVTYELVTEFEHMQKWDKMLLNLQVLERSPKQYPVLRIGTFINTYGVPGGMLSMPAAVAARQQQQQQLWRRPQRHTYTIVVAAALLPF
jgi:hypothetical protein